MDTKTITKLIEDIVAPIVGDYLKELRQLRVRSLERQVTLLKTMERGRRNRELVHATERDDDD